MKTQNKQKIILFSGIALILCALIAAAVVLVPVLSRAAEKQLRQDAVACYAQYAETVSPATPFFLYQERNKTITLQNGEVGGIYSDAKTAARTLLDNPETEQDESVDFVTAPAEGAEGLFLLFPALPTAPSDNAAGLKFTPDDLCTLSAGFETMPVTYEVWLKIPETQKKRSGILLGNYGGDVYPCFDLEIHDNGVPTLYYGHKSDRSETLKFTGVNVCTGDWVHLAVVNDVANNAALCYVNGEVVQLLDAITPIENTRAPRIGGDYRQDNRQVFKGELYSMAVYSDVRSAEEIQSDMKAYGTDALLGAWDLSWISDARQIADASQNGRSLSWPQIWFDKDEKAPVGDYDFSFAVLGDTQLANVFNKGSFPKLFDWIVENRDEKKIAYVLGMGDITDVDTNREWQQAADGFAKLDRAGIPYALLRGNHDSTFKFNQTFDTAPYNQSYNGTFDNTLANSYRKVIIDGIKYLIFTLDFGARDNVLEWAGGIIEDHPTYNVIITTHAYLYPTGDPIKWGDSYAPTNSDPENNNGIDMWKRLISKHENIVLVLCGHESHPYIICTQQEGEAGNVVTQILTDQSCVDSDFFYAGFDTANIVTMLYFSEGGSHVTVECFSTTYEKFYRAENQFEFNLNVIK